MPSRRSSCARKTGRSINRRLDRALSRYSIRSLTGRFRPQNYVGLALSAYSRAIRAHRRLVKLAPRIFDSAVVAREAERRRKDEEYRRQWQPVINKAYGLPPDTPFPEPNAEFNSPEPKCPRTIRAIQRQLDQWKLAIAAAREFMDLFAKRRPHAAPTFGQATRLLDVSFTLKRLACGLDSPQSEEPPPEPQNYLSVDQALEKIYGNPAGSINSV